MFLSLGLVVLVITTITCEPPLNNYLPPNAGGGSGGKLAPQYGPPESSQGFDVFNSEGGQLRDSFDPSRRELSRRPSVEYGSPQQGFQNSFHGQQKGTSPLRSQYRSPSQENPGRIRGGTSSGRGSSQTPESSYGTPSQGLLSSVQNGFNGQGANSQGPDSRRPQGGTPPSTYGTPDFGKDRDYTNQNYRRSGVNESNEPAKYEFSYEVDDFETGTMFGHSEERNGDMTTGQYNVILADGRKQVVQYEANKDGFKPQIRYEDTGRGGVSGFGRGAQPGIALQVGRYQTAGFAQGTSSGYSDGSPDNVQDSFGNQGFPSAGVASSYPGRPGGSSFTNRSPGGGFNSNQDGQGYSSRPQEDRSSPRGGGIGSSNGGSDEGYPRGGPNGLRGSGY